MTSSSSSAAGLNWTEVCSSPASDELLGLCSLSDSVTSLQSNVNELETAINIWYLVIMGSLVLFQQAGFAMYTAGAVRSKNVINILLKNLLDMSLGAFVWYLTGFAFAFGTTGQYRSFVGNHTFALKDSTQFALFFFEYTFANTSGTIVAGTVAERCTMVTYLFYSTFLIGFVYPVVAHAVWNAEGFLSATAKNPLLGVGAVDFAGSGVVHLVGSTTALVASIILAPRVGRFFDEQGNRLATPVTFRSHSLPLQVLGTIILWFGWYGFNSGSSLTITTEQAALASSLAAVSTTLGPACGGITALLIDSLYERYKTGETTYEVKACMNGCLCGLVSITSGCGVIPPWAACIIGSMGGFFYICMSKLLDKLLIDDAVDNIPIHFTGGVWGLIATGLFAKSEYMANAGFNPAHQGLFLSWHAGKSNFNLLLCQLSQLAFILGWVTCMMGPLFTALKYYNLHRLDVEDELLGHDFVHHGGGAYDQGSLRPEKTEGDKAARGRRVPGISNISQMRVSNHVLDDFGLTEMRVSNHRGEELILLPQMRVSSHRMVSDDHHHGIAGGGGLPQMRSSNHAGNSASFKHQVSPIDENTAAENP